jgi:hypothetical protein
MITFLLLTHLLLNFAISINNNHGIELKTRRKCIQKGILKEAILKSDRYAKIENSLKFNQRISVKFTPPDGTPSYYEGKINHHRLSKVNALRINRRSLVSDFYPEDNKIYRKQARIAFVCHTALETEKCRMLMGAAEGYMIKNLSPLQKEMQNFYWVKSFKKYFRGLKSKIMNDPYIK